MNEKYFDGMTNCHCKRKLYFKREPKLANEPLAFCECGVVWSGRFYLPVPIKSNAINVDELRAELVITEEFTIV